MGCPLCHTRTSHNCLLIIGITDTPVNGNYRDSAVSRNNWNGGSVK